MEIVSFLQETGNTPDLILGRLISGNLILNPVKFLDISHGIHETDVVRIVVDAIERRNVLETLDQHSLLAKGIVV